MLHKYEFDTDDVMHNEDDTDTVAVLLGQIDPQAEGLCMTREDAHKLGTALLAISAIPRKGH